MARAANSELAIRRLRVGDVSTARKLNAMFGEAFADPDTYGANPPSDAWLEERLAEEQVIVLVAIDGGEVIGGLVAYELAKLERERREVYIYDLAVAGPHRRRGIATGLIERCKAIAAERGAWVVFVQADRGDDPAIALYEKLGRREEVLHFDIACQSDRSVPARSARKAKIIP